MGTPDPSKSSRKCPTPHRRCCLGLQWLNDIRQYFYAKPVVGSRRHLRFSTLPRIDNVVLAVKRTACLKNEPEENMSIMMPLVMWEVISI